VTSNNHPALIPNPSKLVVARPTQGSLLLVDYWNKYDHYLMLRSFIKNKNCTLNEKIEMQHFVSGCKYSSFLEDSIRREETVAAYHTKFETTSMLGTLTNYLQLPNSPSKRAFHGRIKNITHYCQLSTPTNANIHELNMHPHDNYSNHESCLSNYHWTTAS